jgi:Cys-rich protein (TIGR01571 family)
MTSGYQQPQQYQPVPQQQQYAQQPQTGYVQQGQPQGYHTQQNMQVHHGHMVATTVPVDAIGPGGVVNGVLPSQAVSGVAQDPRKVKGIDFPYGATLTPPFQSTWTATTCGCCNQEEGGSCMHCCYCLFCPCVMLGGNICMMRDLGLKPENTTGKGFMCGCCYFLGSLWIPVYWLCGCLNRGEMAHAHGIHEAQCQDCLFHFCCPVCTLAQERREIWIRAHHRGL